MIKAVKAGDWSLVDGRPVAAGVTLADGEYELRLVAADAEHSAPLPGGEGVVVLDTEVTPGAGRRGPGPGRDPGRAAGPPGGRPGRGRPDHARRRGAGGGGHGGRRPPGFLAAETLATTVTFGPAGPDAFSGEAGDAEPVRVAVTRA